MDHYIIHNKWQLKARSLKNNNDYEIQSKHCSIKRMQMYQIIILL